METHYFLFKFLKIKKYRFYIYKIPNKPYLRILERIINKDYKDNA